MTGRNAPRPPDPHARHVIPAKAGTYPFAALTAKAGTYWARRARVAAYPNRPA